MKILSCDTRQFKRDRHEALGSGRETDIRIFAAKYGFSVPHNQDDFWMVVNQAIAECNDFTDHQRKQAKWWIETFGVKDAPSS